MKSRIIGFAILIATALLFAGCPYSSEVPLTSTGMKLPMGIAGTWEDPDNPSESVEVRATSETSVEVIKTTTSEGSEAVVEHYNGFFSDVNGAIFLNIKEDDEYSTSFYLYKIERIGDNKIKLLSVTPNIREKFTSSEEMKKFFAANMQNSYFYESTETTYFKVK
ncbi:MAG: hypothetical protein K1X54_06900 [Flavobacteriales bacterium]|nr:hypothetical protein [Flavobacteriales bacterium]